MNKYGKGLSRLIAAGLILFGITAPLTQYSPIHIGAICAGVVLGAISIMDKVAEWTK